MASIAKQVSELGDAKLRNVLSGLTTKKEDNAEPTRAQRGWEWHRPQAIPLILNAIDVLMET